MWVSSLCCSRRRDASVKGWMADMLQPMDSLPYAGATVWLATGICACGASEKECGKGTVRAL
jgi:hypothetical protein